MEKMIIVGNGFSIDFVNQNNLSDVIDVQNLFKFGARVPWPKNKLPGFLSKRYCENLSLLGAKPTLDSKQALDLIESIVTCSNVLRFSINKGISSTDLDSSSKVYIDAYIEFTYYLRYLMSYYNSLIDDDSILNASRNNEIINYIKKGIDNGDNVTVVNFNYDIILERMLKAQDVDFKFAGFEDERKGVTIFKPHGSINFIHKMIHMHTSSFYIPEGAKFFSEEFNAEHGAFEIKDVGMDFMSCLPIYSNLVPPAGDANRIACGWSKKLKNDLDEVLEKLTDDSEAIIFGLSYWQVDRSEIDSILTSINRETLIYYINPYPSENLDSVLMCLFNNYVQSQDMTVLGG